MKSKVASLLLDRSHENEMLNAFIRERAVGKLKKDNLLSIQNKIFNKELVKQFQKISKQLPADRRLWKYNMNALTNVRFDIDQFTLMYLQTHCNEELKTFYLDLNKEVEVYKRAYGEKTNVEKFKQNKINDLYTRMGNTLLTHMKNYDQQQRSFSNNSFRKKSKIGVYKSVNEVIYRIDKDMKNDLQSLKNQREYEKYQGAKEHQP